MATTRKPNLLVISNVKPFPGEAGQQMRVRNKLIALKGLFNVGFLTIAKPSDIQFVEKELRAWVNDPIVIPSIACRSPVHRTIAKILGEIYCQITGLKPSNYRLGKLEFSPRRVANTVNGKKYDIVLYEYFHAVDSVDVFHSKSIPCVLDMHDVLWKSWERQLLYTHNPMRKWQRNRLIRKYRQRELAAWHSFDAVITISEGEAQYVKREVPDTKIFLAPMGIDTMQWRRSADRFVPPRIGYYGSMGNIHNQRDALRCYRDIMPEVWTEYGDAEFWIVGGNPPDEFHRIANKDVRLKVTGFVPEVQDLLSTFTAVLCPFDGTFGFRSRLIEVMSLGVPVVSSPEAVFGMGLAENRGIQFADDDRQFVKAIRRLLQEDNYWQKQSIEARRQVEDKFSFDATYGRMAEDLFEFVKMKKSNYFN